jgi:Xaa-Pro aminopeptidase
MSAAPLAGLDRAALTRALEAMAVDGWLIFDFHGLNPIQARVVGVGGLGTRRLFVWLPRTGAPVAIAHRIELQPLADFPGEVRPYGTWQELHEALRSVVSGRTAAMEVSPLDAVPYLDRVPSGVVQLVQSLGATVIPSADLVTTFAARWSPADLAGHRRAAEILAAVAQEALQWAGAEVARGAEVRETGLQRRVIDAVERAGLAMPDPPIVAFQENAALPHYEPRADADRRLEAGQVMLLDLWAGPAAGAVFADQTWMAFAGAAPDAEVLRVWDTVRAARDAVVQHLADWWARGHDTPLSGAALDDVARATVRGGGLGEHFLHRTGHSIDRELHGSGPHLDNFETQDGRLLIPGVGFSVEPGVYLAGRFGVRSEINVFLGDDGPEVTPQHPQRDLLRV